MAKSNQSRTANKDFDQSNDRAWAAEFLPGFGDANLEQNDGLSPYLDASKFDFSAAAVVIDRPDSGFLLTRIKAPYTDYLNRVRVGESRSRVDEVAALVSLTDKEMAKILNISERTLHRKPADEPLDTNMSERLIQLESLINHGLDTFDGRKDTFARWLRSPRPALGDVSPISLLDTIAGFGFVDDELSRIEEGAIS